MEQTEQSGPVPNHPQQEEMPFAIVQGAPMVTLPKDLYIPPDALEVFLDAFEGPLDLLLYLIRKEMPRLHIPISLPSTSPITPTRIISFSWLNDGIQVLKGWI